MLKFLHKTLEYFTKDVAVYFNYHTQNALSPNAEEAINFPAITWELIDCEITKMADRTEDCSITIGIHVFTQGTGSLRVNNESTSALDHFDTVKIVNQNVDGRSSNEDNFPATTDDANYYSLGTLDRISIEMSESNTGVYETIMLYKARILDASNSDAAKHNYVKYYFTGLTGQTTGFSADFDFSVEK